MFLDVENISKWLFEHRLLDSLVVVLASSAGDPGFNP